MPLKNIVGLQIHFDHISVVVTKFVVGKINTMFSDQEIIYPEYDV